MTKSLLLLFLSFLPILCYGQKTRVDPYTKDTITKTGQVILQSKLSKTLASEPSIVNGRRYLDFYVSCYDIFTIREGDEVIFLFNNDSTLRVKANHSEVAEHTYIASLNLTVWDATVRYSITGDDVEMILRNDIKGIRVNMSDEYINFNEIKKNRGSKFKYALSLIK